MKGGLLQGSMTALVTPWKDGAVDSKAFVAFVEDQIAGLHVIVCELGKARIDAGEDHRVVVSFRRERKTGPCGEETRAAGQLQEMAAVVPAAQQIAAARAGSGMCDL